MSQPSGVRGFTVNLYGQSGVAMDWFGLTDPFTQQVPLKLTNTFSGTLWFQGAVVNPRSGYYNFSGVQMGSINSGASATLVMTWDTGVSGWIVTSSPITDSLVVNIATYTSSNYTGLYDSGTTTIPNTLFNRYSGMIKLFGDIYSNDQPTPSVVQGSPGLLSGTYSYAISYILSGWESDIGSPTSITTISGAAAVSWGSITGVSQYLVWRWSGSFDFTLYSGTTSVGILRPGIDLVSVQALTSVGDNGIPPIQTSLFRHRTWQAPFASNNLAISNTATYLSPPASRQANGTAGLWAHGYQLNKNISGTSLLGPFYAVVHERYPNAQGQPGVALQTGVDGLISGTAIADSAALSGTLVNVWYRHVILLGASGTIGTSGGVHVQFETNSNNQSWDDVFIVALS